MSTAEKIELRERRVGEILDAAIKLAFRNIKVLFPLAAALTLPVQLVSGFLFSTVDPTIQESLTKWQEALTNLEPGSAIPSPKFTDAQIGAVAVGGALSLLSSILVTAALTHVVSRLILTGKAGARESLVVALKRAPAFLGANLLLALTVGLPLAVVAGIGVLSGSTALFGLLVMAGVVLMLFLIVRFTVATQCVIVETAGPLRALKRSFGLVKGSWWKVFGTTIVIGLVASIPAQLISQALKELLKSLGGNNSTFEFIWSAIAATVSTALVSPISAAAAVFLYFDLRIRREGFDLEQLAASLPEL